MRTLTKTSLSLCTLFVFATVSNAALVIFSGVDPGANSTDPRPNSNAAAAAFDLAASALGTNNIIDFESAPVGAFTNLTVAPGVTMNGSDVGGSPQTIRNSPFGTPDGLFGYNTTSGGSHFVSLFGGNLTFSFATPVDAFGAYISGVQLDGETITFSDGSTQVIPIPNPGPTGGLEFLGFTDAGKMISSITANVQLASVGDIVGVDDVRYGVGGAAAVPDSGTSVLLFGLGLAGLFFVSRTKLARIPV